MASVPPWCSMALAGDILDDDAPGLEVVGEAEDLAE